MVAAIQQAAGVERSHDHRFIVPIFIHEFKLRVDSYHAKIIQLIHSPQATFAARKPGASVDQGR